MSTFINGYLTADRVIANKNAEKQRELTNLVNGYEKNKNGDYVANELGKAKNDAAITAQQNVLMDLKATNDLLTATMNAKSFGDTVKHLSMGDAESAQRTLKNNPILAGKLKENYGVTAVAPADWRRDYKQLEVDGATVDTNKLTDPKTIKALDSEFFKVIKQDGSMDMVSVSQLKKMMNFEQYAPKEDIDGLRARAEKVHEIIRGVFKSPEEEALADTKTETAQVSADMTNDITKLKADVLDAVINNPDLSSDEKLQKIQGANQTTDYKTMKQMYDAVASKQKVEKNAREAETAKPVEHQMEFYKELPNVELNDQVLNTAKKLQGKNKLASTDKSKLNTRRSIASQTADVIEALKDPKLSKNVLTSVNKILTDMTTEHLSLWGAVNALKNVEINTKTATLLAEYMHMVTGAAATDNEVSRHKTALFNMDWSNKTQTLHALSSFGESMSNALDDQLDGLKNDVPYFYAKNRDDYKAVAERTRAISQETLQDNYHEAIGLKSEPEPRFKNTNPRAKRTTRGRKKADLNAFVKGGE